MFTLISICFMWVVQVIFSSILVTSWHSSRASVTSVSAQTSRGASTTRLRHCVTGAAAGPATTEHCRTLSSLSTMSHSWVLLSGAQYCGY